MMHKKTNGKKESMIVLLHLLHSGLPGGAPFVRLLAR
jgi:hypothetical protein